MNVNSVDLDGNTPLHCACFKARNEIVFLLATNGADLYQRLLI
jgi:ankyrin repeat protein